MICPECGRLLDDGIIICPNCKFVIRSNKDVTSNNLQDVREGKNIELDVIKLKYGVDEFYQNKLKNNNIKTQTQENHSQYREGKQIYKLPNRDNAIQTDDLLEKEQSKNILSTSYNYTDAAESFDIDIAKKRSKNWIIRFMFLGVFLVSCLIAIFFFFKKTEQGQVILARKFKADNPQAYWIVGEEFLNAGDTVNSIRALTMADDKDPNNADGILLLASAYEAAGLPAQAESMYWRVIKEISPQRPEPYRYLYRMLMAQKRLPEVAQILRLGFENTGIGTFSEQLADLLPSSPELSLAGGRYNSEKTVKISSPQGYDIYYIMDDGSGVLPQDGKLYNGEEIKIPEGASKLRAVCTSLNLVSEPVEAKYILIYPSPSAPNANLASGTYSTKKSVSLRIPHEEKDKDLVIHYTIDGSIPTENSPIFDGTPIVMPSGRVNLKAFSQNSRGKISNLREIDYKFDVKPFLNKVYNEEDKFYGIVVYDTSPEKIQEQFGAANSVKDSKFNIVKDFKSKIYNFSWGSAEFVLVSNQWKLAKIEMNKKIAEGPRGLNIGSSEAEVVAAFKDMGQLPNLDGSRGLYYNLPESGKILIVNGKRLVRYTCKTKYGVEWVLEFHLGANSLVDKIIYYAQ